MSTEESDEVNLLDADMDGEQVKELVERFERNKDKNANEIIDQIIDKEAKVHKGIYTKYKYDKLGVIKRKDLNKFDIDKQRQRVEGLQKKVREER